MSNLGTTQEEFTSTLSLVTELEQNMGVWRGDANRNDSFVIFVILKEITKRTER